MLETLYTTQMSTEKEKLKARLENIQRAPKKKHTAMGLLITLVLAAALAVGSFCLAASASKAEDTTMTDEELALFLDQPWGADMATLDYANEEILVFHYNEALCVVDLANTCSFRYIFDLRDLNLTTATQGDVVLEVSVEKDGSRAYLSAAGARNLTKTYDSYVVDLTTGQVKKGTIPEDAEIFNGYGDTAAAIPGVTGWYSWRCVTVGDHTYYLNTQASLVKNLQLVTHYTDGRPDKVWYLFGEPPYQPEEQIVEDSGSEMEPIVDSNPVGSESSIRDTNNSGSSDGNQEEPSISDPPLMEPDHFSDLFFKAANYITNKFYQAYSSDFRILEQSVSDWEYTGENEGTFLYTVTYREHSSEDEQERLQMTFPLKVTQEESGQLTLYQDTGAGWTPTDVQSMVALP